MAEQPTTPAGEERTSRIDPSKITGPYPLMALLLIALEGLLGFWLHAAGTSAERITAGILMTIVFGGVMTVIVLLREPRVTAVSLAGVQEVKPAMREAEPAEAENPQADMIAGPDRSYILRRPPADWTVRELTRAEYLAVALDVGVDTLPAELAKAGEPEILMFRSPRTATITPMPGVTRVDGRLLLTALQVPSSTSLAVLPLGRVQAPLFIERPFEHNFQAELSQVMNFGLLTLRRTDSGTLGPARRRFLSAELRQDLENAVIDGVQRAKASMNVSLIGIEGDTLDHLIISRYTSLTPSTSEFDEELRTIKQLIDSFQPIKLTNPAAATVKLREQGDVSYKEFVERNGESMFGTEFSTFCLRVKSLNLDDPSDRLRAIVALRPFRIFANAIGEHDLDELWEALDTAEKGDASALKQKLLDLVEIVSDSQQPPPPEPALQPASQVSSVPQIP